MDRGKMRECLQSKSGELSEQCLAIIMERMKRALATDARANPKLDRKYAHWAAIEHAYGSDALQKLDFYKAKAEGTRTTAGLCAWWRLETRGQAQCHRH
jgi:hypothetical protein